MSTTRASIFDDDELDVAGFTPKSGRDRSAPPAAEVRAVAEAANFRSREGALPAVEAPRKHRTRRRLTGRNQQFNVKTSQATIDAFYAMADQQRWVLGETLDNALAALKAVIAGDDAVAAFRATLADGRKAGTP